MSADNSGDPFNNGSPLDPLDNLHPRVQGGNGEQRPQAAARPIRSQARQTAALIVRDAAETDPADPHHKDTICINADVLETMIAERLVHAAAVRGSGEQTQ